MALLVREHHGTWPRQACMGAVHRPFQTRQSLHCTHDARAGRGAARPRPIPTTHPTTHPCGTGMQSVKAPKLTPHHRHHHHRSSVQSMWQHVATARRHGHGLLPATLAAYAWAKTAGMPPGSAPLKAGSISACCSAMAAASCCPSTSSSVTSCKRRQRGSMCACASVGVGVRHEGADALTDKAACAATASCTAFARVCCHADEAHCRCRAALCASGHVKPCLGSGMQAGEVMVHANAPQACLPHLRPLLICAPTLHTLLRPPSPFLC